MKKYLVVIFLLIFTALRLFSEENNQLKVDSEEKSILKNSFQLKPLAFLDYGMVENGLYQNIQYPIIYINIEYQRLLTNSFTLIINPTIYDDTYDKDNNFNRFLFDLNFGIFYHPLKTGLRGFYIGVLPVVGILLMEGNRTGYLKYTYSYINIGMKAELGWEFVFNNGFTITLGHGLGRYKLIGLDEIDDVENKTDIPFNTYLRLAFGYSF